MKARINGYIDSIMEESALIKDSGMLFLASFAGSIFLFVANIVLSKQFGPEGFGNFKTVLSLFLFLPALIEFGAGATLTKYIAEGKTGIINWFLKLRAVSYLIVGIIILIFREQIAAIFLRNSALNYLVIPGLVLFLFTFFEVFKPIVQGFQNFKLLGVSQFLTAFFQGVLILILGYYFGVAYALIGWGLAYLFGNLPNVRYVLGEKIKKGSEDIGKIFRNYSIPVYLMIIPGFIGSAIIPIISLFFPQKLIGYYAFAWTFYCGVLLIPTALSSVIFPKISALHGKKDFSRMKSLIKRIFVIYTLIVIVGTLGTLMFSKRVIELISLSYLPGIPVFEALIIFALLSGYLSIYRTYLNARENIKGIMSLTIILNIILLVVSIISLNLIFV